MNLIIYATLLTTLLRNIMSSTNISVASPSIDRMENRNFHLLSRRKRFLIFPEGSSVQLVFCNQNHGYLQIGDIVWFGTTAALAWELPTDPEVYDMFRDQNKIYEATRRTDVIYYLNEDGKVVGRKEYKRKSAIINPAFAKRSVDSKLKKNLKYAKLTRKDMHKMLLQKFALDKIDATKIEYLRRESLKLYKKLEYLLQSHGWSGEDCILNIICSASKSHKQGTFVEEILKAVFTLPKVHDYAEVGNQYDDAQEANGNCTDLYPNCRHV